MIVPPGADYLYRVVVPKGRWRRVADALAAGIGYVNFKGAVPPGEYHDRLMNVCSVMWGMRRKEHGRGREDGPGDAGDDDTDCPPPSGGGA